MSGARWIGEWQGGRVREAHGRRLWVIERQLAGVRYAVTLDVHSERDALAELALFERDPNGYRTRRQVAAVDPGAAILDGPILEAFLRHAEAQGLTEDYRKHILGTYLAEWGVALKRRDLRAVTLRELRQILEGWKTARHHRIVALKSFTAWLREEDRLRRAEDPTLDLKVPQPVAEKSVRQKGYSMAEVERVYTEVPSQLLRDTLCLRAKVGMHDTEIGRVARREAVLREVKAPCGIYGTITFAHLKAGKVHVVSVDAQTFAAAQRLQSRGSPLSRNAAKVMLDRAARRLDAEPIRPSELRHSFATWARASGRIVRVEEGGVPLAEVAAVMGHLTPRTTKVFYEGNEVPPMIILPLRLHHPADPLPLDVARETAERSSSASPIEPRRRGRRGEGVSIVPSAASKTDSVVTTVRRP